MKRLVFAFIMLALLSHGGCADGKPALNMHDESGDSPGSYDYSSRDLPDDLDERVQCGAVDALGKVGYSGDTWAVDPLIAALKDENFDVQNRAMRYLGEIGDTRAVDALIVALKDESWVIRYSAAVALGKIGDSRAIEPLIYLASNDEDLDVREVATEALAKLDV